jgi:hypothetical protein
MPLVVEILGALVVLGRSQVCAVGYARQVLHRVESDMRRDCSIQESYLLYKYKNGAMFSLSRRV